MNTTWIKIVFIISGLYDAIVAILFLLIGNQMFDYFNIIRPNHVGYIQFPALLLIIFGIMFFRIAANPVRFRELIWYGVGLKGAYSGVVLYHYFTAGIPFMWVPFAILDLIFLVVFIACWYSLGKIQTATS